MKIQHVITGGSGRTRLSQELQDELISSIRNGQYTVLEHSRNQDSLGNVEEKTCVQLKYGPTITIVENWAPPTMAIFM